MECKKCKCALSGNTYCMRCGTENGARPTQVDEPQEQGSRDIVKNLKKDDMFTGKIADLSPLSHLAAVAMIFGFIFAMSSATSINILSASSINSLIWVLTLRIALIIIPIAAIIAVMIRRHINYAYESSADEATTEVSRTLFKSNMKVWSIYILIQVVLPFVLYVLSNRMTTSEFGLIMRIIWEFIKHTWPLIMLYLMYTGITSLFINLTKEKYHIIRLTAVISTLIILAIYFFV